MLAFVSIRISPIRIGLSMLRVYLDGLGVFSDGLVILVYEIISIPDNKVVIGIKNGISV